MVSVGENSLEKEGMGVIYSGCVVPNEGHVSNTLNTF